ncbi:creatininase family protein [Streptomyces atratus]|uniref:creatininase family protein n=1 Tax=Streptomyces atratus TaxID=1893 RepID=UPI003653DDF7
MVSDRHALMHAGEIETSILLHAAPELVRDEYAEADRDGGSRRFLLVQGMSAWHSKATRQPHPQSHRAIQASAGAASTGRRGRPPGRRRTWFRGSLRGRRPGVRRRRR